MSSLSGSLIATGQLFFRHRNVVLPTVLVLLCALFPPSGAREGATIRLPLEWLGILIALAGLGLRMAVVGYAEKRRGGVGKEEVHAGDLVTTGFFALSRNPLHVGSLLIYGGLLILHDNLVASLLGGAFFLLSYWAIVAEEERYLHATFATAYTEYCNRVPRWWPQWSRRGEALAGMEFSWGRVIARDYAAVCFSCLALLAIVANRSWHQL